LIEKGADKEALDWRNSTPLHRACLKGHLDIVKLLADKGANKEARYDGNQAPLHIASA